MGLASAAALPFPLLLLLLLLRRLFRFCCPVCVLSAAGWRCWSEPAVKMAEPAMVGRVETARVIDTCANFPHH